MTQEPSGEEGRMAKTYRVRSAFGGCEAVEAESPQHAARKFFDLLAKEQGEKIEVEVSLVVDNETGERTVVFEERPKGEEFTLFLCKSFGRTLLPSVRLITSAPGESLLGAIERHEIDPSSVVFACRGHHDPLPL